MNTEGLPGIKVIFDIDSCLDPSKIAVNFKTVWVSEFNNQSAREFAQDISQAHRTGQPIIPVIIDSYGGEVYSVLSMIAEIRNSELPVATVVKGKAMSAGAVLAACGTPGHRYCDLEATYMIHEVGGWAGGKVEAVKSDAAEIQRLNTRMFRILDEHCGQPPKYFYDLVHQNSHADWYLTTAQAKKHKLVDHVRLPKVKAKVSVNWQIT